MSNKINKVGDSFVCPYCFHRSFLSKIQFRSKNSYLAYTYDEKASGFWKRISGGRIGRIDAEMVVLPRPKKRGLFTVTNSAFNAVPVTYFDEGDVPTDDRVCPMCHNPLSPNTGFVSTANILVIGPDDDNSRKYFMYLMNSLAYQCTVPNSEFYTPQVEISKHFASGEGFAAEYEKSLNEEVYYHTGKIVMSKKNSVVCEITATFMPIDILHHDDYDSVLFTDIFKNVNGILFVKDYGVHPEDDETEVSDDYIFALSEVVHQNLLADDAPPVAVVMTGIENGVNLPDNIDINILCDYQCETERRLTDRILAEHNMNYYTEIRSMLARSSFFTVNYSSYAAQAHLLSFQNPLNWIIKSLNIIEEKKEENNNGTV